MNNYQDTNGNRLVFSEATFQKITQILSELRNRLQAQTTIFADMNGYPIGYDQDSGVTDILTLTALAAGTFSATAEMAKLIRDKDRFRFIYLEGELHNIYMCNVSKEYLMIVQFNNRVAMGMVRILTRNTVEKLEKILRELSEETKRATKYIDVEFKSMLSKELDNYFGLD